MLYLISQISLTSSSQPQLSKFIVLILGLFGVLGYLVLILSFQRAVQNKNYALIHYLLAFIYACWIIIPIYYGQVFNNTAITVSGGLYLIILIISLSIQGTLDVLIRIHPERERDLISLSEHVSSPYEEIANIIKSLWIFLLAIEYYSAMNYLWAVLLFISSLTIIYYILALMKSRIRTAFPLKWFNPNPIFVNVETLVLFLILISTILF